MSEGLDTKFPSFVFSVQKKIKRRETNTAELSHNQLLIPTQVKCSKKQPLKPNCHQLGG